MKYTKLMTRMLQALCAAAITCTLCGSVSAYAADTASVRLMGDLDNNKKVGLNDAQAALGIYVRGMGGVAEATANAENGAADIDMNGKITLGDANNILRYYTQSMGGTNPLWANLRKVAYSDGTDFYSYFETDDAGNPVLDESGQPVLIRPHSDSPFTLKGMYIEIGCASGAPGETVTVPVYTAGLPKLAGFQLLVEHDAALKPLEITSDLFEEFGLREYQGLATNPIFDETHGCIAMAQANDLCLSDGCVIAQFSYQIPEDAVSGEYYSVSVASYYTKFITKQCAAYQYTALDGVILVK